MAKSTFEGDDYKAVSISSKYKLQIFIQILRDLEMARFGYWFLRFWVYLGAPI